MSQKYVIGGQASGFIAFQKPIADQSTYTPSITYQMDIFSGMICFGGNGRGFIINEQSTVNSTVLTINPTRIPSAGRYILYASAPTGSDPEGIAVIDSNSVQDWDSYTGWISGDDKEPWEGDDSSRRAIATFKVRIDTQDSSKLKIDPTSIRTINNFDHKNLHNILEQYGLYELNSDTTEAHNFEYRGQNIIPEAIINESSPPTDKAPVYWNSTQNRYEAALADDTEKEKVVGILALRRDSIATKFQGNTLVITGGIVNVGTTLLPNSTFPQGTYVYLSEGTAGTYARDFDVHQANFDYSGAGYGAGYQIRVTGSAGVEYIVENTAGTGTSDASSHDFTDITGVDVNTSIDGTVTWLTRAIWTTDLFISRKIRIGISLGNGNLLFVPGGSASATTDDHDESSYAHSFIQTAIEKAGIYVYDNNSGKDTRYNRGQYYDEIATFQPSAIADGEQKVVYLKDAAPDVYDLAEISNTASQEIRKFAIGISDRVTSDSGFVVTSGFLDFDTTTINGTTAVAGDEIFVDASIAGDLSTTRSKVKIGEVIVPGANGIIRINVQLDYRDILEQHGIFIDAQDDAYVGQITDNFGAINAGVSINEAVYWGGADYNLADADGTPPQDAPVGIAIDIAGSHPRVVTGGIVKLDNTIFPTSTYPNGTTVYLSTTPGQYTTTDTGIIMGYSLGSNNMLIRIQTTSANSEFFDNAFIIKDNSDTSKKLVYEVSNITTATTRTWTIGDYNYDLTRINFSIDGTNLAPSLILSSDIAVLANEVIGNVDFYVNDTDIQGNLARIYAKASGVDITSSATLEGSLVLQTALDGTLVDGLIIDNAQNVTIPNGNLNITSGEYQIGGTAVLTSSGLGTGILSSSITSLGTIASFVATTVDIEGGTIDATAIGATTPGTGAFTTITSSSTITSAGLLTASAALTVTTGSLTITDGKLIAISTEGGFSGYHTLKRNEAVTVKPTGNDNLLQNSVINVQALISDTIDIAAGIAFQVGANSVARGGIYYSKNHATSADADFLFLASSGSSLKTLMTMNSITSDVTIPTGNLYLNNGAGANIYFETTNTKITHDGAGSLTVQSQETLTLSTFQNNKNIHLLPHGTGSVAINTAGAVDANLCIMGAAGVKHVTLKSPTLLHGITGFDTDTNGTFSAISGASNGGMWIAGFSGASYKIGLSLNAYTLALDTTTSSASLGQFMFNGYKGTTPGSLAATENLAVFTNKGSTKFLIKGNGDVHMIAGNLNLTAGGIKITNQTEYYAVKRIALPTWDMNVSVGGTTGSVAHGLTYTNILSVTYTIINDGATTRSDFGSGNGGGLLWGSTNIIGTVIVGGDFDGTNFNATASSRGFATIIYKI